MRIGVFGAGRMGALRVEDLAADPRVDEVLVANRTAETSAVLGGRFGATIVADLEELAAEELDGYVVTVATAAHAELLERLVQQGRPILCEKPIALSLRETVEICEGAARHGAEIQVAFMRRFDTGFATARAAVADGSLGVLYRVHALSHDPEPAAPAFIRSSGGIFRDLLVHDFDAIRWVTGLEVVALTALASVRAHAAYAEHGDHDTAAVLLELSDGLTATVSATRHDPRGHDLRLEVFGSGDSVAVGWSDRTPIRSTEPGTRPPTDPYPGFVERFREAFRRETAAYVGFAAGDTENPCPSSNAVESLRIAAACERSVQEGRRVLLAEIGDGER